MYFKLVVVRGLSIIEHDVRLLMISDSLPKFQLQMFLGDGIVAFYFTQYSVNTCWYLNCKLRATLVTKMIILEQKSACKNLSLVKEEFFLSVFFSKLVSLLNFLAFKMM